MSSFLPLGRDWKDHLADLVRGSDKELLISAPFLTRAGLGAHVSREKLLGYCQVAERLRKSFQSQLSKIARGAREEFRKAVEEAEDELIRLRLGKGALQRVFEDAILYVLRRQGPLETQ